MDYILLLTGCINPNGMPFTSLTNSSVRQVQYIHSINYYIHNTSFPIVFVENSNTDVSHIFHPSLLNSRIEFLTFCGNKKKDKGKGYGEAEIIEHALLYSKIIASTNKQCCIIKITGRLIIKNIKELICNHYPFQGHNNIVVSYNSDFSFADSRVIVAPFNFYIAFLKNKEQINDFNKIYFENVLSDSIKQVKEYHYYPFYSEPQIIGMSGSTGEEYLPYKNNHKRRIIYLIHATTLLLDFNKQQSNNKLLYVKKYFYILFLLCLKVINKIIILTTKA